MVNPTVFFDIAVDGEPLGRVSFECVSMHGVRKKPSYNSTKSSMDGCVGAGLSHVFGVE
ncbi:PPIA isoform 1 [Pan troglodytes]|uniref:Peptidylprolyl isomerase A n=4 Tax=Homininae TaxID=207598 RepID=E5RIZ5_HUMAN|nr:peptidylprolyl isomerase A [Homo sapiens]KAI4013712.1 peptidylprolyl isomerase A [Homo sapiens]PNI43871.1 PPIA isoform 1 [Pan troglodytes]